MRILSLANIQPPDQNASDMVSVRVPLPALTMDPLLKRILTCSDSSRHGKTRGNEPISNGQRRNLYECDAAS